MNHKILGSVGLLALASVTMADERFFVYTYDWFTPGKFEREIELTYDHVSGGSGLLQMEFEYGVTERWMVAPYLLLEQERGKFKVVGFQLEQRYRLGEFAYGKLMPAAYFEVKKENHESYELEGKLIVSYMPNARWISSGNLIVEKHVERGAETEWGYSVGVARLFDGYNLGIEAKGNFLENEHMFGPVVGFKLADPTMKISLGAMKSFGKGDASRLRLMFAKEF